MVSYNEVVSMWKCWEHKRAILTGGHMTDGILRINSIRKTFKLRLLATVNVLKT